MPSARRSLPTALVATVVVVVLVGGGLLLRIPPGQVDAPMFEAPAVQAPEVERPGRGNGTVSGDVADSVALPEDTALCTAPPDAEPGCAVVPLSDGAAASAVSVLDGRAVVVAEDGAIARRELPGGLLSWRVTPFPEPQPVTTLFDTGLLVAASRAAVVRLNPTSGAVLWRVEPVQAMTVAPQAWTSDEGLLLLDASGRLTLHEVSDGSVRWSVPDLGPEVLPGSMGDPRARSERVLPPEPHGNDGALVLTGVLPEGLAGVGLQWAPVGHEVVLTAVDGDGRLLWTAPPLPLPCCSPVGVPGSDNRLIVAAGSRSGAVLEATTGQVLAVLQAPRGTLVGSTEGVGLWQVGDELLGLRWSDAAQVFRSAGELVTVDPLVIEGPSGPVHVALGDGRPSPPPPRPFR